MGAERAVPVAAHGLPLRRWHSARPSSPRMEPHVARAPARPILALSCGAAVALIYLYNFCASSSIEHTREAAWTAGSSGEPLLVRYAAPPLAALPLAELTAPAAQLAAPVLAPLGSSYGRSGSIVATSASGGPSRQKAESTKGVVGLRRVKITKKRPNADGKVDEENDDADEDEGDEPDLPSGSESPKEVNLDETPRYFLAVAGVSAFVVVAAVILLAYCFFFQNTSAP